MPYVRLYVGLALASALGAQNSPPTSSPFIGSTACRACHPAVAQQFYRNPHFKSLASTTTAPADAGCEGCHGPGRAHVRAGGGKQTILAFSALSPRQVLDTCLRCHSWDYQRANIRRSGHSSADVVCTACHSIHQPATPRTLLAENQVTLCSRCHTAVEAQFSLPSRHRVNEGFMRCTDCHNPHGSNQSTWKTGHRSRMVETALNNEQPCLRCHTDKRGPFLYEHPALRVDGCESCHFSHGSTNVRLLKRPFVFTLCLECHNGAGNFGRDRDGVTRQSPSHNMADPRYRQCTQCHVRIHGSNADRTFLR
jgi:DmsE family decaheme c-type cytochrome